MKRPLAWALLSMFIGVLALERQTKSQVTPVSAPAGIVISEVLFDPKPGDAPFVELFNAGAEPVDLSNMALQLGPESVLPLIRAADPLPPNGLLLVRFDGMGRVEGRTVHAPLGVALLSSGFVELRDAHDNAIDRIAWGDEDGAEDEDVLGRTPTPGRTIGRPPGAYQPQTQTEWVMYRPDEATPGAENPLLPVGILLPLDGATVSAPARLTWYTVTGASQYRVQIARDDSFSSPVFDSVVTRAQVTVSPLAPGEYVWRVQAIDSRGRPAAFSAPSGFEIVPASNPPGGRGIAFSLARQAASPQATAALPDKLLPVPLIYQHKDTAMLQLENPHRDDPHGWDRDHKIYDESDPADNSNCAVASIAMVNHFYRGDLSQDRIGYEIKSRNAAKYLPGILADPLKAGLDGLYDTNGITRRLREKQPPGPEWDLVYDTGTNPAQAIAGISFALNPTGSNVPHLARVSRFADDEVAALWTALTDELNHDRPMIGVRSDGRGTRTAHAFVVKGYGRESDGRRFLIINDPIDGVRQAYIDRMKHSVLSQFLWYVIPDNPVGRRQEIGVIQDTDGDGVVDFDETERFFTDPNKMDSDDDGVNDKEDIAAGVFDRQYGYATHTASTKGRDFDGDNLPTERDPDADAGGCKDGFEDRDGNGDRNGGEKWNFDPADDICADIDGKIEVHKSFFQTNASHLTKEEDLVVTVRLTPMKPGEIGDIVDRGSSYTLHAMGTTRLDNGDCTIFSRFVASGSGTFDRPDRPDNSIGGMIYHDDPGGYGMIVEAGANEWGTSSVESCVFGGTTRFETGASTYECPGRPDNTGRTFTFDCHTPPPPQPDTVIQVWFLKGTVTVAPPPQVGWLPLSQLFRPAH